MIRRVLLVDDEPDIRTIGEMSLGTVGGWQVETADGGAQAIDAATARPPDVILLDVMMPRMDGPSTLKKIKDIQTLESVPIIFLTAKVQLAEVDHYLSLGAAGVIAKPFDPMTLPDEVRRLVEAVQTTPISE